MPDEVKLDRELQLITVRSHGETDIEDWRTSVQEVLKLSEAHDVNEVLVDAREQTKSPGVTDIYDFGASLPENFKFAIVTSTERQRDQQFLETVARNRGKRLRVFWNLQDALRWLGKGEMRPQGC